LCELRLRRQHRPLRIQDIEIIHQPLSITHFRQANGGRRGDLLLTLAEVNIGGLFCCMGA